MTFTDQERLVYLCPVTGRHFDPLAVKRALVVATRNRFNQACADSASKDPVVAADAESVIVAGGRAAFGLRPIDPQTGDGTVDADVIEAVRAFTRWLRGKGPTAQNSPTSAPCTDCPG